VQGHSEPEHVGLRLEQGEPDQGGGDKEEEE